MQAHASKTNFLHITQPNSSGNSDILLTSAFKDLFISVFSEVLELSSITLNLESSILI